MSGKDYQVEFKNRSMTNIKLSHQPKDGKLTVDELACALYEGTRHLHNLAEKLARQHGKAEALSFYDMMGSSVRALWNGLNRGLPSSLKTDMNVAIIINK